MRQRGKMVTWNDDRGFGFLAPADGGPQVFVHIRALPRGAKRPAVGDEVTYEVGRDEQGRLRADNVAYSSLRDSLGSAGRALLVGGGFLVGVAVASFAGFLPPIVFWLYLALSAVTFAFYAWDKQAAQRGFRRTPENTLHLLALLGGWPGALYAQQLFRHKSSKTSFQTLFGITLAANVVGLSYLALTDSTALLEAFRRIVQELR